MTSEITQPSRYFSIDGGSTVVQSHGTHWTRWDDWDGPVATSIWTEENPRLTELTEAEAKARIGARG